MSFRLADLKKTARKGKEGYTVSVARLEGRPYSFRIRFVLQQLEAHLRKPRRLLDPTSLLEVMGDARVGRSMLTTLSQWYRVRPLQFAELLGKDPAGRLSLARLEEHDIRVPSDLRAWLYAAANREREGFLDPETAAPFWHHRSREMGLCEDDIQVLGALDSAEEWILVRTGPPPSSADVLSAYLARAHTTLLRSARRADLFTTASPGAIRDAVSRWPAALGVECQADGERIRLQGRADALGCWTRQGRRLERAALELMADRGLDVQELSGELEIGGRNCRFHWKGEALSLMAAPIGGGRVAAGDADQLASVLRRVRDRGPESGWKIRRAPHLVAVEGGLFLPQLELRLGDRSLFVRSCHEEPEAPALRPFVGCTPVAAMALREEGTQVWLPGERPSSWSFDETLPALAQRLQKEAAPAVVTDERVLAAA